MSFLDAPSPRWFNIWPHRPFLDDLARGLLEAAPADALPDVLVLMPTRRAARGLAQSFLTACGQAATLLPQVRTLGDLDEDEPPFEPGLVGWDLPPAIPPGRRRFELAGLIVAHEKLLERRVTAGEALELADALAAFLDSRQLEEAADADLTTLVDADLAHHWRRSADFLMLAIEAWPRRLAEIGYMDAAERRVALTRALERAWLERPPAGIVVAAGSTGSAPSVAALLAAIARAPRGAVVLPGLDMELSEAAWTAIGDQHPQAALGRLLAGAGMTRADVQPWGDATEDRAGRWRRRILNEALRPAEFTADWLNVIANIRRDAPAGVDPIAEGIAGLSIQSARADDEAASAAALLMRETLETDGKTCLLVTPDTLLARRISARLARWELAVESSSGEPLAGAPAAVLASLIARWMRGDFDPATLLAIAKHPLVRAGVGSSLSDAAFDLFERRGLRGRRPDGWDGLDSRLAERPEWESGRRLAAAVRAGLAPAEAAWSGDTATAAVAGGGLALALEALSGAAAPWRGPAGEALSRLIASLMTETGALPEVTRSGFGDLLESLQGGAMIRARGTGHRRLQILGVLESRLVRADRVILAGLEEGVWPRAAATDPFLSRPMRRQLGLPSPDRRIGLSAHDFANAASAPEVILLSRERRAGAPALKSRWLWRLEALIEGALLPPPRRPEVIAWARALDAPLADPPESLRTAPRASYAPPVAVRPRRLPVTEIERWTRDPYAVYARRILGLRPLDRPDEAMDAAVRGSAVHKAIEDFTRAYPDGLPDHPDAVFLDMLLAELRTGGASTGAMAREEALAKRMAAFLIDFERARRPGARIIVEHSGELAFQAPAGPFHLTARADRIELR
ncbi:MAG: double-strand break repair protein AddB, partial [Caulobacteraceae bacterium]|nr:double-strand break repair protein AddB [Caulobacteraceae bacterium]